jgi:hypothetical protein
MHARGAWPLPFEAASVEKLTSESDFGVVCALLHGREAQVLKKVPQLLSSWR